MTNGAQLGIKLYELRKQAGLSQEELAEKLGVSRQAVSKWECGESLPDTDNLITISKLYNVSLDALVGNERTEAIAQAESAEPVAVEKVHTDDEDDDDEDDEDDEDEEIAPEGTRGKIWNALRTLPYPIVITIAFLLWGFIWDGWGIAWTLYVTIPVYYSIVDCIRTKRASSFCYPVFVAFIYCLIGMAWDAWHPYWVLFITIPIYYAIAGAIDKK